MESDKEACVDLEQELHRSILSRASLLRGIYGEEGILAVENRRPYDLIATGTSTDEVVQGLTQQGIPQSNYVVGTITDLLPD